MIYLIGLGVANVEDISIKGLNAIKKCEKVYLEDYTNYFESSKEEIESFIGKKVEILKREDLENNLGKIIEEAKEKDVAILVYGDPFFATTHISLKIEAKKQNVEIKTIHSSSILTAIFEIGLSCYKFGKIVTIPLKSKYEKLPYSVYEAIKVNKKNKLHTLCLLDIDKEKNEYLKPNEALKLLLEAEKEYKQNIINKEIEVIIACRVGFKNEKIFFDKIENLLEKDFGFPPYVLIIPSELSSVEKEALSFL
ncbi:MAG: diphthine synthase [Candidatus Aenigmatarchaeota archaeon]